MTANLTPQYLDAEERYKKAATPEEKKEALEDMYALRPSTKALKRCKPS